MAMHSSILNLENPHGQRSLAGYSPWGHKELDITEWLSTEHRTCYTEWNKSKREKQIYINVYIQNLEKWYTWTYIQGRNRDADIENGLWTQGEGEGGMNWKSCIEIYTSPCVKQIASRKLLLIYNTRSPGWCSVWPKGVGWWGRLKRQGIYI